MSSPSLKPEKNFVAVEESRPHLVVTPELHESNPRYYGWRVVLAACLGVMAGFGSLFVYTFNVFVKPLSSQFGNPSRSASPLPP